MSHRIGLNCGWIKLSGVCCSLLSYLWSWFCGDPLLTTRGKWHTMPGRISVHVRPDYVNKETYARTRLIWSKDYFSTLCGLLFPILGPALRRKFTGSFQFCKLLQSWYRGGYSDHFWLCLLLNSFVVRYAFTPTVDFGNDDDDNMTLSEAFGEFWRNGVLFITASYCTCMCVDH